MAKTDAYEVVVNSIVEALENAKSGKWKCPWDMSQGYPRNGLTGREYNGVNVLMLAIKAMSEGYGSNEWFTFKQATKFGQKFDPIGYSLPEKGSDVHDTLEAYYEAHGEDAPEPFKIYPHVRKGEKSTVVVFWRFLPVYEDKSGKRVKRPSKKDIKSGKVKKVDSIPMLRYYRVFNREQLQGPFLKDGEPVESEKDDKPRLEDVDAFIEGTGADIKHGGHKACYVPSKDVIRLPSFSAFHETPGYYSTAFHELGHWTGHESRLDRDLTGRFGDDQYAAEELIAELTSAFLCADFQLEGSLQHVEYIDHWISILREDKYAIHTAAREATKAAKLLHGEEAFAEDDKSEAEAA